MSRRQTTHRARLATAVAAAVACATVVAAAVTPAYGAEPAPAVAAPVVGGLSTGDGLDSVVDERDGALRLGVTVAGVLLSWDSRAVPAGNRFGLGEGWGFGMRFLETSGGVRLFTASGEVLEADDSSPSGLHGYTRADLKLTRVGESVLPARAGVVPQADAAYALHELGGQITYFDVRGNPVAQVTRFGERTDLQWSARDPRRLERIIDPDGVVTELDWTSEPGAVVVRRGVGLAPGGQTVDRGWRLRFDGAGTIARVVDPVGGETGLSYEGALPKRITTTTGAVTVIHWETLDDSVPRVSRAEVADRDGRVLTGRTWRPSGASPTGWPLLDRGAAHASAIGAFETILSDGPTRIRSSYSGAGLLRARETVASSATGEQVVRRETFEYPGEASAMAGVPALESRWSRPERIEVIAVAASGATRSTVTELAYDASGRVVSEASADGSRVETAYDEAVPAAAELPIGLPVRETTVTRDGFVEETVSVLNDARTAVVATETIVSGGLEAQPPTVTERVEYAVEPDGFVSEERRFPTGDSVIPAVTRWSEHLDLDHGTRSTVETSGVGTDAEASTSETTSLVHRGVLRRADVFGQSSTIEYDPLDRVVAQTDTAGNTTRVSYESWQREGRNATVVTSPGGVVATEVRDELDRVILRTDNLDHGVATDGHVRTVETIDHDTPGTVTITDAWGATSSVSRDVFGRQVRSVGPSGLTEVTEYDDVAEDVSRGTSPTGRLADAELVTTTHEPTSSLTSHVATERRDGVEVPASSETLDGLGRAVSATDGFLRSEARYDASGRPVSTTISPETAAEAISTGAGSDAVTADRRFDGFGRIAEKQLSDGTGSTSSGTQVADALGRVRSVSDRAGRATRFEYSLDGLVTTVVRDAGQQIRNTYDPKTRALTESVTTSPVGSAVATAYEHDPVTGRLLAVFDPSDRDGSEISYSYDDQGNTRDVTYPDGRQVRYGYDLHGRRVSTTDPAGRVTTFEYDRAGALTAAAQRGPDGAELSRVTYEFDEFGRLERLTRGNGVVTRLTYTSADEVASEVTTNGDGELTSRAYDYDPRGLLTERVDRRTDPDGGRRTRTTRYVYDARERLVESVVSHGDPAEPRTTTTRYELSVAGDVLAESTTERVPDGEDTTTRRFEYSPIGELLAIRTEAGRADQEYDAAGNLVRAADGTTYAYDALNRPAIEVAPDGAVSTVAYWADGARRSLKTTGADGSTRSTEFTWDGDTLLAETHRSDDEVAGTAGYLIGAGRHARTVETDGGTATGYYGTDRHGNVTELTDHDGRVTEQYAYSDYGVEKAEYASATAAAARCAGGTGDATRNPFRYAGEYTDPSCRQHLAARTYDAATMRFTSMDTEAVMNPFAYTDANPITRIDPTGNSWEEDALWNRIYMGMGAAGLVGSAIAVLVARFTTLAPLGPFGVGLLVAGALGDVLGIVSGVIWELAPPWMDSGVENVLSELDTAVSLSIIGIGFGARALYAVFDNWRTSRAALRRQIRYEQSSASSSQGPQPPAERSRLMPVPDSQPSATKREDKIVSESGSDSDDVQRRYSTGALWTKPDIPGRPGYASYGFGTYAKPKVNATRAPHSKAAAGPGKDPVQITRSTSRTAATLTAPGTIQQRRTSGSSSDSSGSLSSKPTSSPVDAWSVLQTLFS